MRGACGVFDRDVCAGAAVSDDADAELDRVLPGDPEHCDAGLVSGRFFTCSRGLHAAHVIGGLIPLEIVIARGAAGAVFAEFHPGIRYVTVYWHFLDVIWVALFTLIYF